MDDGGKEKMYFGGVEGGGTGSNCTILDDKGVIISRSDGYSTNQWLIGMLLLYKHRYRPVQKLNCDVLYNIKCSHVFRT